MSTDKIVLEHLRAIRATLDAHSDDLRKIKGQPGTLEQQYANISTRLDHMDLCVARIESRTGLVEARSIHRSSETQR